MSVMEVVGVLAEVALRRWLYGGEGRVAVDAIAMNNEMMRKPPLRLTRRESVVLCSGVSSYLLLFGFDRRYLFTGLCKCLGALLRVSNPGIFMCDVDGIKYSRSDYLGR